MPAYVFASTASVNSVNYIWIHLLFVPQDYFVSLFDVHTDTVV